jgi:Ca2+-binding EF-hand superfamily protein
MLSDYLEKKGMTIFEFFNSIDLDDSGAIDGYELQQALLNSKIADLPPWDVMKLMEMIDLDGDGRINFPELDIAIVRVRPNPFSEEE